MFSPFRAILSAIRVVMDSVRLHFSHFSPKEWLWILVPFIISAAILAALGPYIQTLALSLLDTERASLYEAAFSTGIPRIPRFWPWVLSSTHPAILLIAFVTIWIAFRADSVRAILVRSALTFALMYTLADLIGVAVDDDKTLAIMPTNIASNLIGGVIFALTIGVMLYTYRLVHTNGSSRQWAARLGAGASIIALSLLLSAACHLVTRYVYYPLPIELRFSSESGLRGFFNGTSGDASATLSRQHEHFSWLPTGATVEPVTLEPFGEPAGVGWAAYRNGGQFVAEAYLYAECMAPRSELPTADPHLVIEEARHLSAELVPGPRSLIVTPQGRAEYRQLGTGTGMVWVSAPEEIDGRTVRDVEVFSGGDIGFQALMDGPADIAMHVSHYEYTRERMILRDREVDMEINGQRFRYELESPSRPHDDYRLSCRAVPTDVIRENGLTRIIPSGGPVLFPMIVIRLRHTRPSDLRLAEYSHVLRVSRMMGNMKVDNAFSSSATDQRGLRYLSFLASQGDLRVDGEPMAFPEDGRIDLSGNFTGRITNERFELQGRATAGWLNGERLNRTKWERMPSDWQLWVIGALLASLVAALTFGRARAGELWQATKKEILGL